MPSQQLCSLETRYLPENEGKRGREKRREGVSERERERRKKEREGGMEGEGER